MEHEMFSASALVPGLRLYWRTLAPHKKLKEI